MAQVIPFPLARRVDFVWRQASYIATLGSRAGAAHLRRQVEFQRQALTAKGADPAVVDRECSQVADAILGVLWSLKPRGSGVA